MPSSVTRNDAASRFELETEEGTAVLKYSRTGGTLDLLHTEVPPAMEGGGQGTALVRGALDEIRAEGLHVVPSCPFVRHFIEKHGEYSDLVARP